VKTDLPDLVVGGIDYRVEIVPDLARNDGADGEIKYGPSLIRMDSGLDHQSLLVGLLHEAIHAILTQAGYTDHDEHCIGAISYGLLQILRDNPWLVGRITIWPRSGPAST